MAYKNADRFAALEVKQRDSWEQSAALLQDGAVLKEAKAAEVALSALDKEANPDKPDYYIKYCLDETMKALDKYTK